MLKTLKPLILCVMITLFCHSINAQNTHRFKNLKFKTSDSTETHLYVVKTKPKSTYIGELVELKNQKLTIALEEDTHVLVIPINVILNIQPYNSQKKELIGTNHYFFSSSSYTIPKGEIEIQSIYGIVNSVKYGINDNFSLTGGITPYLYFAPQVSVQIISGFRLGGQMLVFTHPTGNNGGSIASFTAAFGNKDRNISLGLSYDLSGELSRNPMINLAGVFRFEEKAAFVTDILLLTHDSDFFPDGSFLEDLAFFSLGFRVMGRAGAFDVGVLALTNGDDGGALPFIGYTYRF